MHFLILSQNQKKGNDKGKQNIDVDPSAIVATTKLQMEDYEDPEEGEHLFHQ